MVDEYGAKTISYVWDQASEQVLVILIWFSYSYL